MIGLFGLLGLMLVGMALDASSSDDASQPTGNSAGSGSTNSHGESETLLVSGAYDEFSGNCGENEISGGDTEVGYTPIPSDVAPFGQGDAIVQIGESTDSAVMEIAPEQTLNTIEDFNGSDDLLVVYYEDPDDQPVDFSFTDNGGSGQTEVSLFGQPTLLLKGNAADIGLTIDSIVAVNTAFT